VQKAAWLYEGLFGASMWFDKACEQRLRGTISDSPARNTSEPFIERSIVGALANSRNDKSMKRTVVTNGAGS